MGVGVWGVGGYTCGGLGWVGLPRSEVVGGDGSPSYVCDRHIGIMVII